MFNQFAGLATDLGLTFMAYVVPTHYRSLNASDKSGFSQKMLVVQSK